MTGSKKATNGTSQGRRSKSTSLPPGLPPSSDAAAPSSDSLALPGPSSKKLFPLFDSRGRKNNGKAASTSAATSDVESTANLSESSQPAAKGKKKDVKGKATSNGVSSGSQKSDASGSTKENKAASTKQSNGKAATTKTQKPSKKNRSKSPVFDVDIHDLDTTTSTVASISTSSTTPPPQPHKTIITITDSPVRELKPIKTFADLHAERQAKKAAKEAGGWNGGRSPLWPTRENMHVRPSLQTNSYGGKTHWPKIDWKGKGRAVENDYLSSEAEQARRFANITRTDAPSVLHRYTAFEGTSQGAASKDEGTNGANAVLDEGTLKRLKAAAEDDSPEHAQQTWYQRYAPMRASEVLGDVNKENALYLRDWLKELTLQDPMKILNNSRKRKVKREVTSDERKKIRRAAKRRKRKGYDGTGFESYDDDRMDDFIAGDDEIEYDHYDYYDLSDGASVPSPTKSTTSSTTHQAAIGRFEPLTNVILLAGPVASGKTSTACAVADELGWQVFEVYPGIGKRGYKDLERYVGMVGENHIMAREAPPVSSFFGKAAAAASTTSTSSTSKLVNGTQSVNGNATLKQKDFANSKIATNPFAAQQQGSSTLTSLTIDDAHQVKQSCILIEEVDILYESDSGFWEGLISFISKSRRPVILTCNDDRNSVPKDSLPLQTTLYFESASGEIARALLGEIARLEGVKVKEGMIEEIVKMASDSAGMVDLRLAINQLQYVSTCPSSNTTAGAVKTSADKAHYDLGTVQTILENVSFADAELRRRDWLALQDEEDVAQPEKEDDEFLHHPDLPVHELDPPPEAEYSQPLPCYAREAEFCEVFGVKEEDDDDELEVLVDQQWNQCNSLHLAVDDLLDEKRLRPSDTKLHLDVLPMLRDIVTSDDMHEIVYNVALEITSEDVVLDSRIRRSRRLAGAGKESYRRYLDMSKEVVDSLRGSAIKVRYEAEEDEEGEQVNVDEQIEQVKEVLQGQGESQSSSV